LWSQWGGQIILDAIGIHLALAQVCRGISFSSSLENALGGLDAKAGAPEPARPAGFPLAVPSIAGPGAMMAVIRSPTTMLHGGEQAQPAWSCVVLLPTLYSAAFSVPSCGIIGRQGAAILVRVMGIILASLAVETC